MRALQQAVADEQMRSPCEDLTPLAALEELISLAGSAPPAAPEDRISLQVDLRRALDSIGAGLSGVVETAVADFRRHTLSRIPELATSRDGVAVAAASAQVLKERFLSSDAVIAAWQDVVAAFRGDQSYEECIVTLGVLRELVEGRGHAWEAEVEPITRLLNDSAPHAKKAGASLSPPKNGENYEFEELAGLSEDERLALIEAELARAGSEEEIVVWLLISDAAVGENVVELGPTRFIDARFMRRRILIGPSDIRPFGLPDGIEVFIAQQLLGDLEPDEQAVLVRVRTTAGRADALSWARRAATGLLDIATLGRQRPGWKLEDGHLLVTSSGWWSHRRFRQGGFNSRSILERFSFRPDKQLKEINQKLITAWEASEEDAIEAIELARWEQALAASSNETFRVALGVRNLERVLPSARLASGARQAAHWSEVVNYYLKDSWCWRNLRESLDIVRFHAVSPPHERRFDADESEIDDFYGGLHTLVDADHVSRAQLVDHAAAIAELVPPGSSRGRILRSVAMKTRTARDARLWLTEYEREFDVLLARAARQRNAIVHGSATVPAVIASVLPFVVELGKQVVEGALAAAAEGRPLAVWLELNRLTAREQTAALAAGRPLTEIV
jgi:hypothetical protein